MGSQKQLIPDNGNVAAAGGGDGVAVVVVAADVPLHCTGHNRRMMWTRSCL